MLLNYAIPWKLFIFSFFTFCFKIHPVHLVPCSLVDVLTSWNSGFKAILQMRMEETVDHWNVSVEFNQSIVNLEAWKGSVTKLSTYNFIITNKCYNKMVYSSQCFQLPIIVRHKLHWKGNMSLMFNGVLTPQCSSNTCIEHSSTLSMKSTTSSEITTSIEAPIIKVLIEIIERINNIGTEIRKRGRSKEYSNNENILISSMDDLITYLDECLLENRDCLSKEIQALRNKLELNYNSIKSERSISSQFAEQFEEKLDNFDKIVGEVMEVNTVCPPRNLTMQSSYSTTKSIFTEDLSTPHYLTLLRRQRREGGIQNCVYEKHVDFQCQCGGEICSTGDSCSRGKCTKYCPIGYKLQNEIVAFTSLTNNPSSSNSLKALENAGNILEDFDNLFDEILTPTKSHCKGSTATRSLEDTINVVKRKTKGIEDVLEPSKPIQNQLDFQLVPIDSNGPMATVKEVEDNLETVKKLLHKCDFVKLDDGSIDGNGYDFNVTNKLCDECSFKIIRKEFIPKQKYNANVAEKCCFIMRSNSSTYVLTNHSLLNSFPENCTKGCIYTLYEELIYKNATQHCLDNIENYTCCSYETGAFCKIYGEETKNNARRNQTCSNICKEIADCSQCPMEKNSSRKEPKYPCSWCDDFQLVLANNLTTETERVRRSALVSCQCVPLIAEQIDQSAISFPSALPKQPFIEAYIDEASPSRNKRTNQRSCYFWNLWRYTCQEAYNYPTYFTSKNWYKVTNKKKTWFNHRCCSTFQPYCNDKFKPYSCPSN